MHCLTNAKGCDIIARETLSSLGLEMLHATVFYLGEIVLLMGSVVILRELRIVLRGGMISIGGQEGTFVSGNKLEGRGHTDINC